MPGFSNNINVCNGFATSIYLCYITVYVPLCNKEESITKTIKMIVMTKKAGDSGDDDDDV